MSDTLTREPSTELALIDGPLVPAVVFAEGGVDVVLAKIRAAAHAEGEGDISTPQGRASIKSLAYKIARSKTALDGMGKDLGEEARRRVAAIDQDRRRIRYELDTLAEEVRAPLTSWENQEKARAEGHENTIAGLFALPHFDGEPPLTEIDDRISAARQLYDRDWQEFAKRGSDTYTCVMVDLERIREHWAKVYAEREETARRQAEEAARVQREREAAIAARAAEEAKREAERKAAQDAAAAAERARRQQQAAEEKARQEREAIEAKAELDRQEAARQAQEAENRRIEAEERSRRAREAAAEKARQERVAFETQVRESAAKTAADAIEAERARVAAEAEAARKATEDREADRKHKARVQREARDAIAGAIIECLKGPRDQTTERHIATAIVSAIARGEVPHTRLVY